MIDQLRELLDHPDIGDANSLQRRRLEDLITNFLPCYCTKVRFGADRPAVKPPLTTLSSPNIAQRCIDRSPCYCIEAHSHCCVPQKNSGSWVFMSN